MVQNRQRIGNKKVLLNLLLYGAISLFVSMSAFAIVVMVFPLFSQYVADTVDWSILDGFAGVLSFAVVVGGLTFALSNYLDGENQKRLLHKAEKQHDLEIYFSIIEKLMNPEQQEARRWTLEKLRPLRDAENPSEWYKEAYHEIWTEMDGKMPEMPVGVQSVRSSLNCLEHIGFLVRYWEIEADDPKLRNIYPLISKQWLRLKPYVAHERLRSDSTLYDCAEYIGELSVSWHRRNKGRDDEYVEATP